MGARNIEAGKAAALKIHPSVTVVHLDVTLPGTLIHSFKIIKEKFGRVDILVNNAGIGEQVAEIRPSLLRNARRLVEQRIPVAKKKNIKLISVLRNHGMIDSDKNASKTDIERAVSIMNTNCFGAWRVIQQFLPLIEKSPSGRIINVSSGMGKLDQLSGYLPGYSISKAALNALTIMFANELKSRNIAVNAVCPGWVKTDMGGLNAPETPQEGADTIVWLALSEHINSGRFYKDRQEIDW